MDKPNLVKLPKEVADELRKFRNEGWTDYKIIYSIYKKWASGYEMTPMEEFAHRYNSPFLRALADGYEVDQTPEDKVASYYNRLHEGRSEVMNPAMACEYNAQMSTVRDILNLLNIKIKGVNEHEK